SLTLVVASGAPALAQAPSSPAPQETTSTPQPSPSPSAQPSPQPESSATPPPRQIVRNRPSTAPALSSAEQAQAAANRQVVQQTQSFDQRRDNVLLPK